MKLKFPIIGVFRPGQVRLTWTASTRKIVPQIEATIESRWNRALQRPGIHLFDGPMARLEAVQVRDGILHLSLSHTSYRIFVGTNLTTTPREGSADPDTFANPVGLSTLLISEDGYLVLGRRNGKVAYYPLHVHPFAGCLEPAESVDVFDEVRRELHEELSFIPADIAEITCIGIAEDQMLLQPELIFATRSTRRLREIEASLKPEEHHGIFTAHATQAGIESAIAAAEQFTPIAIASLLLWGRLQLGESWFDAQRRLQSQ
jgi:hypothetical protein